MTVSADLPARQAESAPLAKRHPVRALAPDKARWTFAFQLLLAVPRGVISQEAKIVWQALAIDAREQEGVLFTRMSRAELARNAGAITKSGRLDIHSVSRACGDLQRAGLLTIQQARGGKNTYLLGPLTPLFDLAAVTPTRRNGATPTRRNGAAGTRRNGPTHVKEDEEEPQNHQAPDSEVLRDSEPPAAAASPDGFHSASDIAEQLYAAGVCRGPSDTFAERAPALRVFVSEHGEEACRQALAELPQVEARRRAEGNSALRSPAAWVVARIRKLGAGQEGPQHISSVIARLAEAGRVEVAGERS